MIPLISALIASKADHWAGDDRKLLGYGLYALAIFLPVWGFMFGLGAYAFVGLLYCFVCALALRKWGVWGELFVNTNKDSFEGHTWFRRLVNRAYGETYSVLESESLKRWKVVGWGVRYSIYAMPIGSLYSYVSFDITPILILPLAGLVRGCFYWYGLANKNLAWCENYGGAASMFVLAASV